MPLNKKNILYRSKCYILHLHTFFYMVTSDLRGPSKALLRGHGYLRDFDYFRVTNTIVPAAPKRNELSCRSML